MIQGTATKPTSTPKGTSRYPARAIPHRLRG